MKKRHLQKSLTKANLRQIRFHDLRHTFASLLIQNGESLAYVKEQLGHSSIKMTVDVYGHLVPGANRQARESAPEEWTVPRARSPLPRYAKKICSPSAPGAHPKRRSVGLQLRLGCLINLLLEYEIVVRPARLELATF